MKVVLEDMTIEGNPDEVFKFLSLKENNNDYKRQDINKRDQFIVGTCTVKNK